jgi:general secretion pathway protein B
MSFILDALRKSEHERQRSAIPGLSHVPVATQRHELPRWALLLIGALGAAVLMLGAAWWQSSRAPVTTAEPSAARTERSLALPAANTTVPVTVAPAAAAANAPPALRFEPPLAPRSLSQAADTAPPQAATSPNAAAPVTPLAGIVTTPATVDPSLPSATALAAQGIALPTLRLELHAYAERRSERFVFINGRKYVEGDRLAEGPELVTIAPNGAVLRHLGQRFLLPPE